MILSYWEHRTVIQLKFYNGAATSITKQAGTAWSIFPAFCSNYGLTVEGPRQRSGKIQEHLNQNQPIVVSVNPGEFTDVGQLW